MSVVIWCAAGLEPFCYSVSQQSWWARVLVGAYSVGQGANYGCMSTFALRLRRRVPFLRCKTYLSDVYSFVALLDFACQGARVSSEGVPGLLLCLLS